jgi:hypothetical protein
MFYGQRAIDLPDGLPKWSGINDESELMEDSPPEAYRALEEKKRKEREKDTHKDKKQKNSQDGE